MTVAIGVILPDGIVVAADRMFTFRGGALKISSSTFGESHIAERDRIEEGGLKLYPLDRGRACFAFAGVAMVGNQVAKEIERRVDEGRMPSDAFREAIEKQGSPLDFEAFIACYGTDEPAIRAYNIRSQGEFTDGHRYVGIGSLPQRFEPLFREMIHVVIAAAERHGSTEACLVKLLASLQAIGIHQPLVERGIGGAFLGCWVSRGGVHWQPRITYLMVPWPAHEGHVVHVMPFDEGIVIQAAGTGWLPANLNRQFLSYRRSVSELEQDASIAQDVMRLAAEAMQSGP